MTLPSPRFEGVTDYIRWDHQRLDDLQGEVRRLATALDRAGAARAYVHFEAELLHHIRAEEELVFPAFEQRAGTVNGPTAAMRWEHWEILKTLRTIHDVFERGELARVVAGLDLLDAILPSHRAREERLYPTVDSQLTIEERAELAARLATH